MTIRQERITGLIKEELGLMIPGELSDPKLAMVRVTKVQVSRDLRNVKVYVFHDDEEVTKGEVVSHLRRVAPYLRGEVATRCNLRAAPELLFYYDDTPVQAARVDELLQQIAAERSTQADNETAAPPAGENAPMPPAGE